MCVSENRRKSCRTYELNACCNIFHPFTVTAKLQWKRYPRIDYQAQIDEGSQIPRGHSLFIRHLHMSLSNTWKTWPELAQNFALIAHDQQLYSCCSTCLEHHCLSKLWELLLLSGTANWYSSYCQHRLKWATSLLSDCINALTMMSWDTFSLTKTNIESHVTAVLMKWHIKRTGFLINKMLHFPEKCHVNYTSTSE